MPECKACEIKRAAEWRKNNLGKSTEYKRMWKIKNADFINAYNRQRKLDNPEKIKDINSRYKHKRRALKNNTSVGDVPLTSELLARQNGMCANCKCKGKKVLWHLDHIMPLSKGGGHTADNVEVLCANCNLRKNAKHPLEWAAENGRLL